ncbi:hypothetical protein [Microtetraspora glauca]|uniref:Lactococcin 972 family bacteriocin n=1 Tax=Microtetraspora glauca TaxID=1996 RepID=A0ABV3GPW6_MICGL
MRKPLIAALTAASLLFVTAPAASATSSTVATAAWCAKKQSNGKYYYKHGKHWDCVFPGAYCASSQHGAYGYSARHEAHSRRYKCVRYTSSTWRWKPVP